MKFYFLLPVLLLLTACKTQSEVSSPTESQPHMTHASFFKNINQPSTFETVKIKSKIDTEVDHYIPTIDAVWYIENGKKIWLNATILINVARGIATPEGIKGYEKWNKTYIDSNFGYLNKLLNVNFINYQTLQNILIGKTFIPIEEKKFHLTVTPQGYVLTSKENEKISIGEKITEYKILLKYNLHFNLTELTLQEPKNSNSLELFFSGWTSVGMEKFPKNVKIIIKGEKNGKILIENTKFEFSKMQTPYAVPNGYTKVEIK